MPSPIADTYGALYLGVIIGAMLYGSSVVQTYMYFQNFPKDRPALKALVAVVFLLDSLHMALTVYAIWHYLIDSFGHPQALLYISWSLFAHMFLTVVLRSCTQFFYAWRIHVITTSWIIPGIITAFSVTQMAFTALYVASIALHTQHRWSDMPRYEWVAETIFATAAVADLGIVIAMSWSLRSVQTSFENTATILNKLLVWTVGTGLLTMLFGILTLALFMQYPHTLYSTMLYMILAKLYANSFLVSLNSRRYMRGLLHSSTLQGPIKLPDIQVRTRSLMQFGEHDSIASTRHDGRNDLEDGDLDAFRHKTVPDLQA